jgi:predicted dehydrogenase
VAHLHRITGRIRLAGVCDFRPPVGALMEGLPYFRSVEAACEAVRPAAAIVAVNEEAHADVLGRLLVASSAVILCEKPLTATLDEATEVGSLLRGRGLTVNFVERQSRILEDYFAWSRPQNLVVRRVDFFWGKHRLGDARPTIGVMSELVHPLDLIDYLFGFRDFTVRHAFALASAYTPIHPSTPDTVSLVALADDYPVIGSASFAWPSRMRRVIGLLADDRGRTFRATFDFDCPRWDEDQLQIEEIDATTGRHTTVISSQASHSDWPVELDGIGKVTAFVERSLNQGWHGGNDPRLVGYAQALKIQRLLAAVDESVARNRTIAYELFGDVRHLTSGRMRAEEASAAVASDDDLG